MGRILSEKGKQNKVELMKKLSAIILWCLLAILSGCTTAQFDKHHSSDSSPEPKLSLDEAKAAFEETYSIALTKSGSGNGHRNKLSPGEFTPLWDNAAYSENPKACSYDVKLPSLGWSHWSFGRFKRCYWFSISVRHRRDVCD